MGGWDKQTVDPQIDLSTNQKRQSEDKDASIWWDPVRKCEHMLFCLPFWLRLLLAFSFKLFISHLYYWNSLVVLYWLFYSIPNTKMIMPSNRFDIYLFFLGNFRFKSCRLAENLKHRNSLEKWGLNRCLTESKIEVFLRILDIEKSKTIPCNGCRKNKNLSCNREKDHFVMTWLMTNQ